MPFNKSIFFPIPFGRSRCCRGFTLTEIAVVLMVMSIILAGIWTAAGIVNEKSRVTQAVNQFNLVAQNMTSLLQGGYGVSTAPCAAAPCSINTKMIKEGVIPQWLIYSLPNVATDPWNPTGFYMSWMTASPPVSPFLVPTYRMSFYGVTRDACTDLIMQLTNCTPGQPGCPITVWTGGKQPVAGGYSTPPPANTADLTAGEITSTTAQNLCDPALCPAGLPNCNTYVANPTVGTVDSVEFDLTQ